MKTLTYPNQYYSSLTRKGLTPLFRDRMSYNYGTSLYSATMHENTDCFVLNVLVPGLNRKDLNIQIDGTTLTISSNLPADSEKLSLSGLRDFSYAYWLPSDADPDHITAKCRDGLLAVQIPKLRTTNSTRKTIPVKGSENRTLKTNPFRTAWNQVTKGFNFSGYRFKNFVRSLGVSV